MSFTPSLLSLAMSAVSNRAAMPASMCMSLQIPEADESIAGKIKVVGRYRTRWLSPGANYCDSPLTYRDHDEEYPDFPMPVPPPISLTLADESKEEQEMPKIQVVHRWRTESIPANQPFCLTPLPTGRVIATDVWSLRDDNPTPPPSLMPIPDEAFFHGPPQAAEPSLIPIYHRSRTEWIRPGDNFALTPGFNLEEFNAHVCEPKSAVSLSWADASAWALAQKSSKK